MVFRFQFERLMNVRCTAFYNCDWTICESPIDLPMSDVGLIEIRRDGERARHYLLPLSPHLILDGVFYFDDPKASPKSLVKGHLLTRAEAESRLDCICASAVMEVICPHENFDIASSRIRAERAGIRFNKIVNPRQVLVSGLGKSSNQYCLKMVSRDEYTRFIHSYIQPPELQ